jgi:hypothetical protein
LWRCLKTARTTTRRPSRTLFEKIAKKKKQLLRTRKKTGLMRSS